MSQPITTQYMAIELPTILVSVDYVDLIQTAFDTIDNHDHYNSGKSLTEKSVLWSEFNLKDYSLLETGYIQFNTLSSDPSAIYDIFVKSDAGGIDLYYKNLAATIRITQNGAVGFQSVLNAWEGDFKSANASIPFDSSANRYDFFLGSDFGNVRANKIDISESLIAESFFIKTTGNFVIPAPSFFPQDSVICTEGNANLAAVKFETIDIGRPINVSNNPRLITSADRFNNVQTIPDVYFRQTRYHILQTVTPPTPKVDVGPSPNSCVITITRGTQVNPIRNSNLSMQHPAQEVFAQNTTPLDYQTGAFCFANPTAPDADGFQYVEAYALLNCGLPYSDPLMKSGNRCFNAVIGVYTTKGTPIVAFFEEYHGVDSRPINGSPNIIAFSAFYKIKMFDLATSTYITNFYLSLRI